MQKRKPSLERLSLEQKVAQMLMVGFPGLDPEAAPGLGDLIDRGLGGVILFSRNLSDPAQVAHLTRKLQSMAARSTTAGGTEVGTAAGTGAGIPLFISADQEGGVVSRLPRGATTMPGNMAIAATGREENAYRAAAVTARELRALGININLAPVLDVNCNPKNPVIGVRSYGESSEEVARFGVAAIKGYLDNGLIATAKHFPGHGDTAADSHLELPTVPHSLERLRQVELLPFREAIRAGVQAIMTAHVTFPAIDPTPGLPATLSKPVLTGLLRREMGFSGLIFTDCMEMKAIADNFGTAEAAVMTVKAGADMVLVSHTYEKQLESLEAIVAAVRRGEIPEERIDVSVARILSLKEQMPPREGVALTEGITESGEGLDLVGAEEHRRVAREIARQALTLVKDDAHLLPLAPGCTGVLVVEAMPAIMTGVEDAAARGGHLAREIRLRSRDAAGIAVGLRPSSEESRLVLERGKAAKVIVFGSYSAALCQEQAILVRQLAGLGRPMIVVSFRNPYDLGAFPEVGTYLAAYEYSEFSAGAAAEVLFGEISPEGCLPVSIDLGA